MTAAEIYAEVATWPEGAKPECLAFTTYWYCVDTGEPVCEHLAELAFIGSGVKWLAEQGCEPQLKMVKGFWVLYDDGMRTHETDLHPTPLAAVGKAVRSVKQ